MNTDISQLLSELSEALLHERHKGCTAESCAGRLIAKTFTDLAGRSDWLDIGWVSF